MGDDPLTRFTSRLRPQTAAAAAPKPQPAPALVVDHHTGGRQAYEAFENQVRSMNVEVRCFRSGLSYSIPYAHLGAIVFNFRTGGELMFTGCGYAVTIKGRNLRDILLALNLHTCGFIQEFHPDAFVIPQPEDSTAAFVESIEVEVLHSPKPRRENE